MKKTIHIPTIEEDNKRRILLSSSIIIPYDGGPPQRVILTDTEMCFHVALTIIGQYSPTNTMEEFLSDKSDFSYNLDTWKKSLKKARKAFFNLCKKKMIPLVIPKD